MSEHQVGAVERDALEAARARVIAHRCSYFQRLQDITVLAESGIAGSVGYRSLEGLIADRDNLDTADAKRLVAEAADLCARCALSGEKLPARLPCTGQALATGAIDPTHVKIIRETMRRVAGLLNPPPPEELAGVEKTLADNARVLPPRLLRVLAKKFLDLYDPDGAAPPDGEDARDEMRLLRRKDGSLVFKGQLHDPLDAEAAIEVFGVLAGPAGTSDQRSLEARQAEAFKDLVQDARGPHGLATDTRHEHHPEADTNGTDTDTPAADGTADTGKPDADGRAEPGEPGEAGEPDTHAPDEPGEAGTDETGAEEPTGAEDPAGRGAADDDAAGKAGDEAGNDEVGNDEAGGDEAGGEAPPALIPEPRRPTRQPAGRPSTAGRGWTERPGRALLTVTIDHRWLCQALADKGGYGTLDSGHNVDAATVRRWACDAEIVPMILGSTSEPLDVGRTQRTAPDAIRRALNLRDGGCSFPGCTRRPRRCQAHHIRQWTQHGGATALDNMCLLCREHHALIHHGQWTITMINGRPWFTPPWVVDPERRPRPGGRPRVPT